jgi:hypothetical protein
MPAPAPSLTRVDASSRNAVRPKRTRAPAWPVRIANAPSAKRPPPASAMRKSASALRMISAAAAAKRPSGVLARSRRRCASRPLMFARCAWTVVRPASIAPAPRATIARSAPRASGLRCGPMVPVPKAVSVARVQRAVVRVRTVVSGRARMVPVPKAVSVARVQRAVVRVRTLVSGRARMVPVPKAVSVARVQRAVVRVRTVVSGRARMVPVPKAVSVARAPMAMHRAARALPAVSEPRRARACYGPARATPPSI